MYTRLFLIICYYHKQIVINYFLAAKKFHLIDWRKNKIKDFKNIVPSFLMSHQRNEEVLNFQPESYTYRVLQTIQMKLILLCVWAEPAIFDSAKTALRFKYEI